MTPCQCRHEWEQNGKVTAVIIPRLAASHGLIACGDLSGDDFVYWRHEFAILRMAASHEFEPCHKESECCVLRGSTLYRNVPI